MKWCKTAKFASSIFFEHIPVTIEWEKIISHLQVEMKSRNIFDHVIVDSGNRFSNKMSPLLHEIFLNYQVIKIERT